jgi:hypothetical protein
VSKVNSTFSPWQGTTCRFVRLTDSLTDQISGQGWTEINLQDASGLFGLGLSATYDKFGLSGSLAGSWGASGTEGHGRTIAQVDEVDPPLCPRCSAPMRILAVITSCATW